jgi:D-ornithine 4,5-aminomutase subunit alpha
MIDLAKKNTTPSIERSVLIRMGFNSVEAKSIVDQAIDRNLMRKGAGHCVFLVSKEKNLSVRDAGLELMKGEH